MSGLSDAALDEAAAEAEAVAFVDLIYDPDEDDAIRPAVPHA